MLPTSMHSLRRYENAMAYSVTIAAEAMREYERIVAYLSNTLKSPKAAKGFLDEFICQVGLIRENPELHALSRMPELAAKGYRPLLVSNYVALYKIAGDAVVIAHVFHQSQDYAKLI